MGLLDGLLGQIAGPAAEMVANKFGLDPAMAQNLVGSLMTNMQNGQSPQDAIAAVAQEHGIDAGVVSQIGDSLGEHAGAEGGLGGLAASLLGGAGGGEGGIAGMLGGLLGGKAEQA